MIAAVWNVSIAEYLSYRVLSLAGKHPISESATGTLGLPSEFEDYLAFSLIKTTLFLTERLNQVTAPDGLTPRHFGLLRLLHSRGPMRQTDIAELLRGDRTTVMQFIDHLERLDMVVRERDPDDRRANAVTLTAKGLDYLEANMPRMALAEDEFLEPLSLSERKRLKSLVKKLLVTHW
ncbi:MarR family transcriptional regulator [Algiphilus sp. W345]|uniref:MarR family transcriptional regulator n=1 Tax=Banduia mediterranea TaxID=3075609 RepID=A0ABU2WHK3_9GAMM|nr:MarR family transcriptional regulator [Algiphilus sp. W345]MDT0496557.1 MarR family transcriptional regulator [Algiphilus sp. W345]